MIFCKNTFLLQFFDWWQASATVEVKKGLLLASEITIVSVTLISKRYHFVLLHLGKDVRKYSLL